MLAEILGIGDEDGIDQLGIMHEIDAARAETDQDYVAIFLGTLCQKGEPITAEVAQIAADPSAGRPRRQG